MVRIELPLANGNKKIIDNYEITVGDILMLKKAGVPIMKALSGGENALDVTDAVEALIVLMGKQGVKREDMTKSTKNFMKYVEIFMTILDDMFQEDEDLPQSNNATGE